jgi:hypothetical protein
LIDTTQEGLRIRIIDNERSGVFRYHSSAAVTTARESSDRHVEEIIDEKPRRSAAVE